MALHGLTSTAHLGETAQNEDVLMAPADSTANTLYFPWSGNFLLPTDFPSDTGPAVLFPVALINRKRA